MAVYQCKMCGGSLSIEEGGKTAICDYCMTRQSIPETNDEKKMELFNRANGHRIKCEFDKAMTIYEHLLAEDASDAETYWNIVLCRYGIEYVEDPKTKQQIPTVNRTQMQSILSDTDYLMALKHADPSRKKLYEDEAAKIDQIEKEIFKIIQQTEPYDVFISYKEKDDNNGRTITSVLSEKLYNLLTKEGLRVFFSRISLEDILGQKYEPYIYSALSTSKVMLVIGTKRSEFMAPWVKNEWSRFLTMMRSNSEKVMIPCYKDMETDDLPDEFQILQCQDMAKIGFEQDILRGIQKICNAKKAKAPDPVPAQPAQSTTESLLKRAFICIGDEDFEKADHLTDQVLNIDPCEGKAYLGKLLIEFHIDRLENLGNALVPLSTSKNYNHVLEYCDEQTIEMCKKSDQEILEKNRQGVEKALEIKLAGINAELADLNRQADNIMQSINDLGNDIEDLEQSRMRVVDKNNRTYAVKAFVGFIFYGLGLLCLIVSLKSCIGEQDFSTGVPMLIMLAIFGAIGNKIYPDRHVKNNGTLEFEEKINRISARQSDTQQALDYVNNQIRAVKNQKAKLQNNKDAILERCVRLPRGYITSDDLEP